MKRTIYIILSVSVILIILAAVFKKYHWTGGRELNITGAFFLLLVIILSQVLAFRNKQKTSR